MHCFLETSSSKKTTSVSSFCNLPIRINLLILESKEIFLCSFSPNKTSNVNNVDVTIFLSFCSSDIISILTSIKKLEKLNKSPFSNNYNYIYKIIIIFTILFSILIKHPLPLKLLIWYCSVIISYFISAQLCPVFDSSSWNSKSFLCSGYILLIILLYNLLIYLQNK